MKAERAARVGPSRTVAAAVFVVALLALLGFSIPRASAQSSTTTTTVDAGSPPSLVVAPPDAAESDTASSSSSGLSTDAKLAIVVGGLVGVGVLIGVLTFFYWRHTRPPRYRAALDALADIDDGASSGAGPAGSGPREDNGPPTEEIPAFVAAPPRSVRIIEPVEPDPEVSPEPAPEPERVDPERVDPPESAVDVSVVDEPPQQVPPIPDPAVDEPPATEHLELVYPARPAPPPQSDDVACIRETLFGAPRPEAGPSSLVTLEDLFGPSDDPKGTVQR